MGGQGQCPPSAFRVRRLFDFKLKHFTADPLPVRRLTPSQHHNNGFGLKPDSRLALIVEGTVETASV